ncbi:AtpZ/AtpI family protein [Salaquimonas pukyongi]|uniref:AtpZ/AtpI family protein n=1 Tax=Salaquimonas pukyongi TaxID=2712698 RepID=UPI0009FA198C|nr:AtpZ/AtpI family protein [Salaquimonas pukyongi]
MAKSGKHSRPKGRPGTGLEQRLESLEDRLDERRPRENKADKGSGPGDTKSGFAIALRLSSEFISAILVGAGIGYLLDTFVGTTPWGMIVFLLIGFAAGVVNVLRSSGELSDPYSSVWAPKEENTNGNSPGVHPDEKKE